MKNEDLTLTEALTARGFSHRPTATGPMNAHDIVDDTGAVVATLKAHEAWAWLTEQKTDVKAVNS